MKKVLVVTAIMLMVATIAGCGTTAQETSSKSPYSTPSAYK